VPGKKFPVFVNAKVYGPGVARGGGRGGSSHTAAKEGKMQIYLLYNGEGIAKRGCSCEKLDLGGVKQRRPQENVKLRGGAN